MAFVGLTESEYGMLRAIAAKHFALRPSGVTLQPTAVVHEALLKLSMREGGVESAMGGGQTSQTQPDGPAQREGWRWASEEHFLAAAAIAIRHILVDHARRRAVSARVVTLMEVKKSGGGKAGSGGSGSGGGGGGNAAGDFEALDVLALHEQLERLGRLDERAAQVVELRFFAGLTAEQTAQVLAVSISTVESDWRHARAWLASALVVV